MKSQKTLLLILLLLLPGITTSAQQQITIPIIRTGVYISPPFVMRDSMGYYTGMAIDLWELLEDEMNFKAEYIEYPSWTGMMHAVEDGEIDAAVSNISVTYERAQRLKFSFPWFDSGLRILVKTSGQGNVWNELKRNGHLQAYIWILLILILLTLFLTLFHRKREPDFPRNWIEGFTESLYRLVLAIKTGVVDKGNYTWIGKVLAVGWMMSGIGLVAYVTSTITSSMTTVSLTHDIHSLTDLPGKRVGVLTGGVAEAYMRTRGIPTIACEGIDGAVQMLIDDEIDAVVEDAPTLEYWVFRHPEYKMKVVGNLFHLDKYAFAASRQNSERMDSISVEIIKLFDNEKISEIRNRYFGNVH